MNLLLGIKTVSYYLRIQYHHALVANDCVVAVEGMEAEGKG